MSDIPFTDDVSTITVGQFVFDMSPARQLPRAIAHFDLTRKYRYALARDFTSLDLFSTKVQQIAPCVLFIMLNPSTADAMNNDPTVTRCMGFAQAWGFKRLVVVNLFALRSTDPKALYDHEDPVGALNDQVIVEQATDKNTAKVIAAWGAHGKLHNRGTTVCEMLGQRGVELHSLGVTKFNEPRHPLYLPAHQKPSLYFKMWHRQP